MLTATALGMWLAQAPLVPSGPPTFLPQARESLIFGGTFRLKHERFLSWEPVYDLRYGWQVALRPTWYFELAPTHPKLKRLSLAIVSTATQAPFEFGLLRPRLQVQLPRTSTPLGFEVPIIPAFSYALNTVFSATRLPFRPGFILSGRF